jgi:subfamily B ATP-binding cassette protein MsbA
MHEVFTGILVVKAYNTEEKEALVFRAVNRKYFRIIVRALKMQLLMAPLMEVVAVGSTLVFLVYSYSRNVTLTELTAMLLPAFMAYKPIKELAKISTYLQRSMAAADRYFALIDTDTSIKENPAAVEINDFKEEISFNNVVFSYNAERKILNDISLKIKKGSVVAVVGETGSGKTTIANLIARFYDVDSGSVTVDGIDVRDLQIKSLRKHIGIVSQDAILFNDTIANNIAYGCPDATREQIIEAAMQANAHHFITDGRHPEGYDTEVGDKGCKLSGGEKQRVAIARAILKNPPILILDEATSALDTVTERQVQEALNRVMSNRTVFAIAHRLSTIQHANLIIVLKHGKIVESGTHAELLAHSGAYKKLHETQFGKSDS